MEIQVEAKATLGQFLKGARYRLSPEDMGFTRGRRRTPGLRREEVAILCEISTTWYTWLEQGRTEMVSSQTLVRIARALKLSPAERSYLFKLAHQSEADTATKWTSEQIQHWQGLVNTVNAPAYIMDRHWDLWVWNTAASDLFNGWLDKAGEHNLLRFMFFNSLAKSLIVDWQQRSNRIVAEYRADSVDWQYDKTHLALIEELCNSNVQFKSAWNSQQVLAREGGLRQFKQNDLVMSYEQFTLHIADHHDMKMVILQPLVTLPVNE